MKTHPTHTPPVHTRGGGTRHGLLLTALSLALIVPLWGPLTPTATADAQQPAPNQPSIPGLTDPPWLAWNTQTLDPYGATLNTETATDDQDRVWVAYDDEPNVVLGLQYRDDNGWHQPDGGPDQGKIQDLEIGPDGRAWTIWTEFPCGTCLSIYNATSDTWTRIKIPENGADARIEFNPDDTRLHAAWKQTQYNAPDNVQHATYNLTTQDWTFENITHGSLGWLDLAIGPEERVHVAWTKSNTASTYARKAPDGTWTVTDYNDCDTDHALATDDTGTLHWVCKNDAQGVLYKQRTPDGDWANETAQDGSDLIPPRSPGHVGFHLDIDIDSKNRPHITYGTGVNVFNPDDPRRPMVAVYAVKLANGWHEHTIDRQGTGAGDEPSLALDSNDRPHIAYIRAYKSWQFGCHTAYQPCDVLRYAEPFAATAAWAADGAAGEPVGLAS